MIFALMDLPPSLDDFYDLEDHPLLAPFLLMRRRFRFLLRLVVGRDGARVAGYLREIGDWDLDDDEVRWVEIVDGKEVARR